MPPYYLSTKLFVQSVILEKVFDASFLIASSVLFRKGNYGF